LADPLSGFASPPSTAGAERKAARVRCYGSLSFLFGIQEGNQALNAPVLNNKNSSHSQRLVAFAWALACAIAKENGRARDPTAFPVSRSYQIVVLPMRSIGAGRSSPDVQMFT